MAIQNTGYSSTPLSKKLGIKDGDKVIVLNQPLYYWDLMEGTLPEIQTAQLDEKELNFVHIFITTIEELETLVLKYAYQIKQNGMIWVSWPKKSSKLPTEITEDTIRDFALVNGLVDVKVCAIDEIWSGLKLVIPLKLRK